MNALASTLLVLWLLVPFIGVSSLRNGFTTIVQPGKRDCFYEQVQGNVTLDMEYQVIEGGMELDVDFSVKDPTGRYILQEFRKTDEVHSLSTTTDGIYEFCFDNSFSTIASKTVFIDLGFYQYADDEWIPAATADQLDGELQIEVMKEALEKIRTKLDRSLSIQDFIRARERRHFRIVENNRGRVLWWSLIQSTALVGVAVAQVTILKNFFGVGKTRV